MLSKYGMHIWQPRSKIKPNDTWRGSNAYMFYSLFSQLRACINKASSKDLLHFGTRGLFKSSGCTGMVKLKRGAATQLTCRTESYFFRHRAKSYPLLFTEKTKKQMQTQDVTKIPILAIFVAATGIEEVAKTVDS